MKSSQKGKTVIALYDDGIKYLSLKKNNYGFYVENYDSTKLEKGIIENGEVLKADFLKKILLKVAKKIDTKSIDLILPHDYFLFDLHTVKKDGKKKFKKLFKKYIKENIGKISWAKTHSYEYDVFEGEKETKVLFRALTRDAYSSYEHVFKKSGLKINSIQSDIVSFSYLFPNDQRVSQIFVGKNQTYVLEYRNGIYISDKKFDVSYNQFLKDIKKNINVSDIQTEKIFSQYGVLKTHKDAKVLARMERSLSPLFNFLKKSQGESRLRGKSNELKVKQKNSVFVHFEYTPIKGLSNRIKKLLKNDVYDMCILELKGDYTFQDVLSLHKKDSYQYESLIARALLLMKDR